ncbi:MAG: hypothetical protein P1U34_06190 [Coxiellaceae bacterium]|nr:hypothetical protein [Coxiellaceae bacterium]
MSGTQETYDYTISPYAERWGRILSNYERLHKTYAHHRALMSDDEKSKDASRIDAMKAKGFGAMWRSITQVPKFQAALTAYNDATPGEATPDTLVPTQSAINTRSLHGHITTEQAEQLTAMAALHDDLEARWDSEFAEGMALSNELTLFKFIDLLHKYDIKLLDNVVCHVWSGRETGQLKAIEAAAKHDDHATMADDEALLCIARFYDSEALVINKERWEYDYDQRAFGPLSSAFASASKPGSSPTFHPGTKKNGKGVLDHGSFTDGAELSVFSAMGTPVKMPALYKIGRANSMRGLQTPHIREEKLIRTLHAQHVLHYMVEKRDQTGISLKEQRQKWYEANPDFAKRVRAKKQATKVIKRSMATLLRSKHQTEKRTGKSLGQQSREWYDKKSTVDMETSYIPSILSPDAEATRRRVAIPRVDPTSAPLVPRTPAGAPPSSTPPASAMSIDSVGRSVSTLLSPAAMSMTPSPKGTVTHGRRAGHTRNYSRFFQSSPLARRPSRRQSAELEQRHAEESATPLMLTGCG